MFWSYCAYILFMVGAAMGLTRHAAEPSLWFISMGWVLQMTLILLRALGSDRVKFPERAVEKVIKGMLPHNKLGAAAGRKLKVYAGPEHPHEAQQPEQIELKVGG